MNSLKGHHIMHRLVVIGSIVFFGLGPALLGTHIAAASPKSHSPLSVPNTYQVVSSSTRDGAGPTTSVHAHTTITALPPGASAPPVGFTLTAVRVTRVTASSCPVPQQYVAALCQAESITETAVPPTPTSGISAAGCNWQCSASGCYSGWSCQYDSNELCSANGGCGVWHSQVDGIFAYNGSQVWTNGPYGTWFDFNENGGIGFSVTTTQNVVWNNGGGGGNGYMNAGNNFSVCLLVNGFPGCSSYWQRINVNTSGSAWATGS